MYRAELIKVRVKHELLIAVILPQVTGSITHTESERDRER